MARLSELPDLCRQWSDRLYLREHNGPTYTYSDLSESILYRQQSLVDAGIHSGDVVALMGDYEHLSITNFLALVDLGCIVLPLCAKTAAGGADGILGEARVEKVVAHTDVITLHGSQQPNILYDNLREKGVPGLLLATSGSTGKPKIVVHDLTKFLDPVPVDRYAFRSIPFLLFDHVGGVNGWVYSVFNGGTLYAVIDRTIGTILDVVEKNKVDLLGTTPTFLRMMVIRGITLSEYDLSSLKIVTYGTERMPEDLLGTLKMMLPGVRFKQKYGLSETGITQTKDGDSTFIRLGDSCRVRKGVLEIRAESFLGYLNASSPVEDGWFQTGDRVEVDGEYVKILGRESEMINVGGQKVHPSEIESLLLTHLYVDDCEVYSEKNSIVGQIICADLWMNPTVRGNRPDSVHVEDVREYCFKNLPRWQVPVKIRYVDELDNVSARFKRMRRKT